jgi:hypothetical protein
VTVTLKTQLYALQVSRDQLHLQLTRLENLARHNANQREKELLNRIAQRLQNILVDIDHLLEKGKEES